MKAHYILTLASFSALTCISICASAQAQTTVPKAPKKSLYLSQPPLNFAAVVPPPPAAGSAADKADLAAVHAAQASRTAKQIAAAKHDDAEEDIFIYATVLGDRFNEQALPLTAALSRHVRNEAGTVSPSLKELWGRPRPFVTDKTVHAICEQKIEPSYPSGHSMVSYLEAFTLAQMVPEHASEILARASDYAHNRVICGVHYPSDTEASRLASMAEFGALSTSPKFQEELSAARKELRTALNLPL